MELGQAKLKVLNFVKLSCHKIPVCFCNIVYIHKNIYHFKIPQVIVIATILLCGNTMALCDIEGFSLQNMSREHCLKRKQPEMPPQGMIFLHNSRVRYIINVFSLDKKK
jgi:hypothetical protein